MYRMTYRFEAGAVSAPDTAAVTPQSLYEPGCGFGFVTEENRRRWETLRVLELNSGFEPLAWLAEKDLTAIGQDGRGCFGGETDEAQRYIPLCFKCDVPRQGIYRVTLTVKTQGALRDVRIFIGRRRLAAAAQCLAADETYAWTFPVDVSSIIPQGRTEAVKDQSIDLAVVADAPRISSLTVEEIGCPVLYIAGDSTVTDQPAGYPYAAQTSYAGWGQMLPYYLSGEIAVSNHAHSGLTTAAFRGEGHYRVIEERRRPGDYLLLQFGHNDQKERALQARTGYRENLERYLAQAKKAGMYPLLVTPLARNTWRGDGTYNDLLRENAEVCRRLGEEQDVPVLDLHRESMRLMKRCGEEGAKRFFYPGDYTHTNDCGAQQMARFVAGEIRRVCAQDPRKPYRRLAAAVLEKEPADQPRDIGLPEAPEGWPVQEQRRLSLEELEKIIRMGEA